MLTPERERRLRQILNISPEEGLIDGAERYVAQRASLDLAVDTLRRGLKRVRAGVADLQHQGPTCPTVEDRSLRSPDCRACRVMAMADRLLEDSQRNEIVQPMPSFNGLAPVQARILGVMHRGWYGLSMIARKARVDPEETRQVLDRLIPRHLVRRGMTDGDDEVAYTRTSAGDVAVREWQEKEEQRD